MQGDIVAVYNKAGTKLVSYTYDAWGKYYRYYHNGANINSGAAKSPFRYRGYYYDEDLGLYYLGSRYYDSNIGRFINADGFVSTSQGLTGNNMFAYCGNNPINRTDSSGAFWGAILTVAFLVASSFAFHEIVSSHNYAVNKISDNNAETTTKDIIIEDQKDKKYSALEYGLFPISHNGCEVVAVHNAKIQEGMSSSFSETANTFNDNWAMIGLSGYFGSNPYQIGRVLDAYDMSYSRVTIDEMTQAGTYIFSYWNGIPFLSSLHTVMVTYDGEIYTAQNPENKNFVPTKYGHNFICAYYIN